MDNLIQFMPEIDTREVTETINARLQPNENGAVVGFVLLAFRENGAPMEIYEVGIDEDMAQEIADEFAVE